MGTVIGRVARKREIEEFLHVPYVVYADDPHYVYPLLADQRRFLDPGHNPFHKHAETALWVARRDGRAIARVAACVDRNHNEHSGEPTGFFGFYECPPEAALSRVLLDTAAAWLRERGMTVMRGPCSFTTNHDALGLLIEGEPAPPVVGMPYNPSYYRDHIEGYGMQKSKDLWAWQILVPERKFPQKIEDAIKPLLAGATFTVRPMDMTRFAEETATVRRIYNAAWHQNWGFIPMDDAEFAYAAKDMRKMVAADFLLIAEADGQPVGFCLTIPDFNIALKPCRGRLFPFGIFHFLRQKRKIRYARTPLLGVLPEYRQRGIDAVMIYKTFQAGFAHGYTGGECSWILEDNRPMNRILASIGARVYRTYRIYDKPLP